MLDDGTVIFKPNQQPVCMTAHVNQLLQSQKEQGIPSADALDKEIALMKQKDGGGGATSTPVKSPDASSDSGAGGSTGGVSRILAKHDSGDTAISFLGSGPGKKRAIGDGPAPREAKASAEQEFEKDRNELTQQTEVKVTGLSCKQGRHQHFEGIRMAKGHASAIQKILDRAHRFEDEQIKQLYVESATQMQKLYSTAWTVHTSPIAYGLDAKKGGLIPEKAPAFQAVMEEALESPLASEHIGLDLMLAYSTLMGGKQVQLGETISVDYEKGTLLTQNPFMSRDADDRSTCQIKLAQHLLLTALESAGDLVVEGRAETENCENNTAEQRDKIRPTLDFIFRRPEAIISTELVNKLDATKRVALNMPLTNSNLSEPLAITDGAPDDHCQVSRTFRDSSVGDDLINVAKELMRRGRHRKSVRRLWPTSRTRPSGSPASWPMRIWRTKASSQLFSSCSLL